MGVLKLFALEELDQAISSLLALVGSWAVLFFCFFIVIQHNMHVIDIVKNCQENIQLSLYKWRTNNG